MKTLDAAAAAAEIKSAVDNAIVYEDEGSGVIPSGYVQDVCAALHIEDSPANLVLVTRELVRFGIRPHAPREFPKYLGATKTGVDVIAENADHEQKIASTVHPGTEPPAPNTEVEPLETPEQAPEADPEAPPVERDPRDPNVPLAPVVQNQP